MLLPHVFTSLTLSSLLQLFPRQSDHPAYLTMFSFLYPALWRPRSHTSWPVRGPIIAPVFPFNKTRHRPTSRFTWTDLVFQLAFITWALVRILFEVLFIFNIMLSYMILTRRWLRWIASTLWSFERETPNHLNLLYSSVKIIHGGTVVNRQRLSNAGSRHLRVYWEDPQHLRVWCNLCIDSGTCQEQKEVWSQWNEKKWYFLVLMDIL